MGLTKRLLDIKGRPGPGFKKLIADTRKIVDGIEDLNVKALDRFGAILRQDIRKMIGNPIKPQKRIKRVRINGKQIGVYSPDKSPRPAGAAPRARSQDRNGGIRKVIYITDPKGRDVKVGYGSVGFKMGTSWGAELHEYGGAFQAKVIEIPTLVTAQQITKKKLKRGGKRTVNRLKVTAANISGFFRVVSSSSGVLKTFKMPKRPTLSPAFDRHAKKMSEIWKDYYKARFG
jgi:hypothetical protein